MHLMLLEKLNEKVFLMARLRAISEVVNVSSHIEAPGGGGLLDKAIHFGGFFRTVEYRMLNNYNTYSSRYLHLLENGD